MQREERLHPFDPVGLTPPKGRQGHSVPTPRPLSSEGPLPASSGVVKGLLHQFTGNNTMKLDSWSTSADLQHSGGSASSSGGSAVSPVQFYVHRDHSFGGSLSKLERMRSHQDPPTMEPFDEAEEDENSTSDGEAKLFTSPSRKTSMDQGGVIGGGGSHGTSRRSSTGISGRSNPNMSLDKLTGDSLLSFSYSAAMGGSGLNSDPPLGGSFVRAFTQGLNSSLTVPGPYLQSTSPTPVGLVGEGSGDQSNLFPTASRNPNKAIVTIDAQTSKILVANEMTCELFGYRRSELFGMKVQSLFTESYHGEQRALVEQNISASGETQLVSGKVMDAVTSYGIEFPVSVWMRKVGVDTTHSTAADTQKSHPHAMPTPRVIVVIEPVERSSALFSLSASHVIASCDPWFACLFGFEDSLEVIGKHVTDLIPSLKLPASLQDLPQVPSKQAVTGRAKDGTVFPLTVNFTDLSQCLSVGDLYSPTHTSSLQPNLSSTASSASEDSNSQQPAHSDTQKHLPPLSSPSTASSSEPSTSSDHVPPSSSTEAGYVYINAKVVVYAALSGMVSFFPDGTIHGCNQHFALMLFGYSQQELQKKDISFLLPDFHHQIGYLDDRNMPLPPLDEEDSLFHSAAERSLSPDKALEYIAGFHEGRFPVSPSQMKPPSLLSHSRHPAPLHFPDLNEETSSTTQVTSDTKMTTNGSMSLNLDDSTPHKTVGETTSNDSEQNVHTVANDIPSVLSISADGKQVLPPVPNRLVPSRSTERILALLTQRGLTTDYHTDTSSSSTTEEGEGGGAEDQVKDVPLSSTPATKSNLGGSQEMDRSSLASVLSLPEGTFLGNARHKDGSLMAIVFQLKRVTLADGQDIYCMWLSRDLDVERARTADLSMSMNRYPSDPYGHNVVISPEVGLVSGVDAIDGAAVSHQPQLLYPLTPQGQAQSEEIVAIEGEYALNYETLHPLGKGAFGFVKVAKKLDDNQLVVVKFLRKSSVLKDCWLLDEEMGKVPLEIALLARLHHDNVIQLLEAYENEHFFQMVMEKHGEGLDLFEFIEKSPRLTEQHVSYVFRQMVSAIAYLHGMDIVHRDIKDENIIINQYFHIKLIDFGSAAHMGPEKKFNTFCGTLEYCSPEVLLGNSYTGPELEMWAVGVTLYTLVFGENPFFDVEETIAGHLQPPFLTSPGLMKILLWLLHPDPKSRATIPNLLVDKWTNQPVDAVLMHFDVVLGHTVGDRETDAGPSGSSGGATGGTKGPRGGRGGAVKSNSEGGGIVQLSQALRDHMNLMETGKEGTKERKGQGEQLVD